MPVPCGHDKVLSSAMSWSLQKCISAHVSLLLKSLLWLPSTPSIKTELLTLALVLCPELDLTYLWLHLPTLPHLLPVTQPPETSVPTTRLGCCSLSHLLPPCRPMTFLPFRDQLKSPTTPLKSHSPPSVQAGTPGTASGVSPPGPSPGSTASEANPSPSPRHTPIHKGRS